MISKLFLLRHGQTPLAGKYAGITDVDLTHIGEIQISEVRPFLLHENIDRVLCSPLLRCRKSLEILDLSVESTVDPRLQEVDFGEWDGKSFAEIAEDYPEDVRAWTEGGNSFCFPGGECLGHFISRLENVKKDILKMESKKVLLVAHGGVIRYMICSFLGLSYDNYLLFHVQEGRYSILDVFDQGAVLSGFNIGSIK
jgi:alpha-ribazole phosphatase